MKRFCPLCGYDQFGRIPPEGGIMRCTECEQDFNARDLQTFSRKPLWWYWIVLPLLLTPALAGLVAPMLDALFPDQLLRQRITFWALAASPVFLYVLLCWIFAALVLSVLNALLIGLLVVMRS